MFERIRVFWDRATDAVGIAAAVLLGPVLILALLFMLLATPYCMLFDCGPSRWQVEVQEGN